QGPRQPPLREPPPPREVRDGHRVARLHQRVHERPALRRVPLPDRSEPELHGRVQVGVHSPAPSAWSFGTLARPINATTTKIAAEISTMVPPAARPQLLDAASPATTAATPIATLHHSVPRNERASSCPLATGRTIMA